MITLNNEMSFKSLVKICEGESIIAQFAHMTGGQLIQFKPIRNQSSCMILNCNQREKRDFNIALTCTKIRLSGF